MRGSPQVDLSIYKRAGQQDNAPTLQRKNSLESCVSGFSGATSVIDDQTSCTGISETRIANDFQVEEIAEDEESLKNRSFHSQTDQHKENVKLKNLKSHDATVSQWEKVVQKLKNIRLDTGRKSTLLELQDKYRLRPDSQEKLLRESQIKFLISRSNRKRIDGTVSSGKQTYHSTDAKSKTKVGDLSELDINSYNRDIK